MLRTISCLLVQISTHSHLLPEPDNNQHTWGTQEETAKSCLLMYLKLVKITMFLLGWSWHNWRLFTGIELSHTVVEFVILKEKHFVNDRMRHPNCYFILLLGLIQIHCSRQALWHVSARERHLDKVTKNEPWKQN